MNKREKMKKREFDPKNYKVKVDFVFVFSTPKTDPNTLIFVNTWPQ